VLFGVSVKVNVKNKKGGSSLLSLEGSAIRGESPEDEGT